MQNPLSNETYTSIVTNDAAGIGFDSILSISYGKFGEDFNFCDKSYKATKDHETQFEVTYKLKHSSIKNDDSVSILVTAKLISNTVFDAVQSPCEFGRISIFENFLIKKFYVKNYNIELTVS